MWTNEASDKKGFEAHPEGSYPATCVDIFEHTKDNPNYNKPKPITIGSNTVKFTKGEINVGCTTISNETVRAIAAKLID